MQPFNVSPTPRQTNLIRPHNWNQTIAVVGVAVALAYVLVLLGRVVTEPVARNVPVATIAPQGTQVVEVNVRIEHPTATPTHTPTVEPTATTSNADRYGVCSPQSKPDEVCVNPTHTPGSNTRPVAGTPTSLLPCDIAADGSICIMPTPYVGTNGGVDVGK